MQAAEPSRRYATKGNLMESPDVTTGNDHGHGTQIYSHYKLII